MSKTAAAAAAGCCCCLLLLAAAVACLPPLLPPLPPSTADKHTNTTAKKQTNTQTPQPTEFWNIMGGVTPPIIFQNIMGGGNPYCDTDPPKNIPEYNGWGNPQIQSRHPSDRATGGSAPEYSGNKMGGYPTHFIPCHGGVMRGVRQAGRVSQQQLLLQGACHCRARVIVGRVSERGVCHMYTPS